MKIIKKYKKYFIFALASLLLIFILSFFVSKNAVKTANASILSGESFSNYERIEVLPSTNDDFFILVTANGNSHICVFNSKENTCAQIETLNFKYAASASNENKLCLIEYSSNEITKVHIYSAANFSLNLEKTVTMTKDTKVSENNSFCFLKDSLFYINEKDRSSIIQYDLNEDNFVGDIFHIENDSFVSISPNCSKDKILATTSFNKYIMLDLSESQINSREINSKPDSFFKFLTDDILISESNSIYSISNNYDLDKRFKIENTKTSKRLNAIFLDENTGKKYILSDYDKSNIYCLDISNLNGGNSPSKKIVFENSEILTLGYNSSNSKTIVILKNSNGIEVKLIKSEDLVDIPASEEQSNEDIENDSYILNLKNKRIIIKNDNISTVREFKEIFEEGGYKVSSITNYLGKNISGSEKIGTGSTVKLAKGDDALEYKIIVLSDITGEGNANSKDKTALFNYLLGKTKLTEDVLKAADINTDGNVDAIDLLALDKILREKVQS